jgi:hypothetical protein
MMKNGATSVRAYCGQTNILFNRASLLYKKSEEILQKDKNLVEII